MIKDYIDYVSLKRKELGGHSICPFAKPLLDKIEIIESNDFFTDAIKCINNQTHPALYLIYGDKNKYNIQWLKNFCDSHKKYARDKDIWLIWDHPNQINKINGIKTSNDKYAILFIQPLSEIKKYSNSLHKTNYYNFWSQDYYYDVVKNR